LNHLMNKSSISIFTSNQGLGEPELSPYRVSQAGFSRRHRSSLPSPGLSPGSSEGSPHHRSCCVTQELRWGFNLLEVKLPATYRSKRPQVSPERLYVHLDAFPALKVRASVAGTPPTREMTRELLPRPDGSFSSLAFGK